MSDVQRDRVAAFIHAWNDGARLLARLPAEVQAANEALIEVLLERLQACTTMSSLAETYTADVGEWPAALPWPGKVDRASREHVVVAATYWRRYQQLLALATDRPLERRSAPADSGSREAVADLGPQFGHLEMLYTAKLWQRGPLRLRSLPPDRRARYEALVETVYARVADCRTPRELAARYYRDGEWILRYGRETLAPVGEPLSNVGWVQDAACWRRYQELLDGSPVGQGTSGAPPAFALWLAEQMTRNRVSVAELAHRLGTFETVVRSWLSAADLPEPEHGRRLAAAFGLPESQLPRVGEATR